MRTLAKRALPGTFVYLVLSIAYGFAILDQPRSRHVVVVAGSTLLVLGAVRVVFHVAAARWMHDRPGRWRWWFGGLALASILVWDGFASIELVHRGLDPTSVMLVVASAGLRASANYSLSPDLRILRCYSTVSRLPMLVSLLSLGGRAAGVLFFLISVQTLYGLMLGRRLNREFWQAVATNETLERRTEALDQQSRGLERANAALTAEIAARERVEVELRLAQKLEAVGRLAAGVAHEINTPLQAIAGNVHFAADGVKDLLALVATYRRECQALAPGDATAELGTRLTAAERAADLDFLVDNLPDSLDMARDSLVRTATIVRSIREFARPDEIEMTQVDLNRAVEATLATARHEYDPVADLDTELGELPPITCHAGEINQVILNLMSTPRTRSRLPSARAAPGAGSPSAPGRSTTTPRSRYPTPAAASPSRSAIACSTRSSPPRRSARALARAWRSRAPSSRVTAARSRSTPSPAAARPSASGSRSASKPLARLAAHRGGRVPPACPPSRS